MGDARLGNVQYVHQINFGLLESWLPRFQQVYTRSCAEPGERAKRRPKLRVIDTSSRRIITASPDCQYAALSYVWGSDCEHVKLQDHHIFKDEFGHEFANMEEFADFCPGP